MKLRFPILVALMLAAVFSFAQRTARVQIIHNSPTPTVDIYVNGDRLLDNFAFRTATPFISVPAGVRLNIGVGLASSASVRDTLVNFPVTLDSGKTYIVVANGVVGDRNRPFGLAVTDMGRETVTPAANVGITFFHGSPDAPAVDILAGTSVLFGNTSYGNFASAGYANVPANATYNLAVTPAGANSTVVARYSANLSFWAGRTAVVVASGFLGRQGIDDRFEPFVVLSNGGTFPLTVVQAPAGPAPTNTARLQVIHNSPTPTVDIYVNGALTLDNFAFRTATPYLSLPAGNYTIGVAGANSTSVRDTIASFGARLDSGRTYVAVAYGVVGNAQRPFRLAVTDQGRMMSANANNVDINFFHGSPDAPDVDILAGTNIIFDNMAYGRFGSYVSVPANATYRLSVTPATNNSQIVARYDANLSFWRGRTAIIMATGFLGAGSATPFVPYVVLSNGGTFPLTALTSFAGNQTVAEARSAKGAFGGFNVTPNPASDRVLMDLELKNESDVVAQVTNLAGQVIKTQRFDGLGKGFQQLGLNVNDLASGMYILRVESNLNFETKKLVINR
ncbi:MAG: DUF4397 domain-containing protein [Saprospiraceae bacterium]|nr:DUF4397 domain-containing protein [Saprospiraceae bacterium]